MSSTAQKCKLPSRGFVSGLAICQVIVIGGIIICQEQIQGKSQAAIDYILTVKR